MKNYLITLVIFIGGLLLFTVGTGVISQKANNEGAAVLNDAIRRASVQCYAIEGAYPSSVEYLTENYGIRVDWSKYDVNYEGFASNIMPGISVIQKEID